MRCCICTLAICLLVGCQNQTVPINNPFMPADRVPPPSTRVIPPGTAQPYYSGTPAPTLPPGANVPQTFAPGNVVPPTVPVTPTTPPGGWNPQPPAQPAPVTPSPYQVNPASAEVPVDRVVVVNEPPVQIQSDTSNLRFNTPAIQTLASVEPLSANLQNQPVVPARFENVLPTPQPWDQTAGSPNMHVAPRDVSLRAVSSPGAGNTTNSSGFRSPSRDGFRPQGSHRDRASRPANERATERFGFDPQYSWLRGQLDFDPNAQQWQLRYIAMAGQADQHGGQLLISNPMVLGDLQPGDHVQVQGRLGSQQIGPTTVVPVYTISAVQRQR